MKLAYTIPEVMEESTLGRDTIYKAINSGKLRARKEGKRTIVLGSDLRAYLEELPLIEAGPADEATAP